MGIGEKGSGKGKKDKAKGGKEDTIVEEDEWDLI